MPSIIDPGRFDDVKPREPAASSVRVIPIAVEGRAPPPPQRNTSARNEEAVHPPWHNAPQKVIPIHLESTPVTKQPQHFDQQQQQAPWRAQAAANANQIASMMEE